MLANTRFRTVALVALPFVVLIYLLLQRKSADGASGVIESFHHYTHKLVDLGAIETVHDYTHKLSEALPWHSPAHSEVEVEHASQPDSTLETLPSSTASIPSTTSSTTLPAQSADLADSSALELPHLQRLCHQTNWTQGLWLQCNSYCGPTQTAWCGGLNNARNRFQACLRLAIDAGAGLIIPEVWLRGVGTADATVGGEDSCADDWFDLAHADHAIRNNCPQLSLRAICPNTTDRMIALAPPPEPDHGLLQTPRRHYSETPYATGDFYRNVVIPTLQAASRINESSGGLVDETTILEFGDTFVAWEYGRSNELDTVRKDLYKVVRFRKSLCQIGEKIRDSEQLQHGSYIAVHLRGEIDWPVDWGSADEQMELYAAEMAKIRATDEGSNVTAVFVSSGEQEVIQVFREMLEPLNYTVHDKWTVLADFPHELATVQDADFDSKGIVDTAVLIDAMYFMGVCARQPTPLFFPSLKVVANDDSAIL